MMLITYPIYILMLMLLVRWSVKEWISHKSRKLESEFAPVFKELIHRHVYMNTDLYQIRIQYIDLPLKEFKQFDLEDRGRRKVLIDVMMRCGEQFPGEKKRLLKKLYKDLDLELYTIIELNFVKAERYIASIKELMAMEVKLESSRILPFLKNKNPQVRSITREYLKSMKNYRQDFVMEEFEQKGAAVLA